MTKLEECARAIGDASKAFGDGELCAMNKPNSEAAVYLAIAVIRRLMEPTADMIASALPHVEHPADADMKLGASAFEILSPGNTARISEGVMAGAELAKDFRAMLQSVLEESENAKAI